MSLEFVLMMTGLGVLAMFSALVFIVVTCEVLKRVFKESEIETSPAKVLVDEVTLDRAKISGEEEAIITAAVMAYFSETPRISKRITTLTKGERPMIWNMAGRIDLIESRIRREG